MVLDIERGINTAKRENQEDICSAQEHLQILTASQFSYSWPNIYQRSRRFYVD